MFKCLVIIVGLVLGVSCRGKQEYGAPMKVSTSDPGVVDAAKWAVEQLNGELNSVLTAERQLVAGLLYTMKLTMSKQGQEEEECVVKVWVRIWLPIGKKLVYDKCVRSDFIH